MNNRLDPIHPGEILLEEFLKPTDLSQKQLAVALDIPAGRDLRNCSRETRDYSRYGGAAGSLLWNVSRTLD